MWPFKHRKCCDENGCEIDPEELKGLTESSPVKIYVNLVLIDMARHGPLELDITTHQPPPWPPEYDQDELPPTHEIINRLKVMSQLDPIAYAEDKEGHIALVIQGRDAIAHVRFRDESHGSSAYLRLELAPGTWPEPENLPLTQQTRRRLDVLFTDRQRWLATKLLVEQCGRNLPFAEKIDAAALERIRIAALKVCDGRLDLLEEACTLAQTDWRDLLVAAGFENDPCAHLHWRPDSAA